MTRSHATGARGSQLTDTRESMTVPSIVATAPEGALQACSGKPGASDDCARGCRRAPFRWPAAVATSRSGVDVESS